jgi:hypothetical protein
MCVVGGKDAEAEARDEKVVASANEKGGEYDERRGYGIEGLVASQPSCDLAYGVGLGERITIEDSSLIDAARNAYPLTSRSAPRKTTIK